ncbi:MAG: cyclic pyranopterin monophosphate synthase MoaC [Thermodesulfovibrionales bacterium]
MSHMLTHIDTKGKAVMVDVSEKPNTTRTAKALASVYMKPDTLRLIKENSIKKGDVLAVAKISGIMAVKNTSNLIPLCHPLPISSVEIEFKIDDEDSRIDIITTVKTSAQTGVEIEAITGCAISAITIYDMCKAVDKDMMIGNVKLLEEHGGRSGSYIRTP